MTSLFDFSDPNLLLRKTAQNTNRRQSGTLQDTVKHGVLHTASPEATLHHSIIAACPHPDKARADSGEYYMVAYVSLPIDWVESLDEEVCRRFDVSFKGPAGIVQKLPPSLMDMDELIGPRVYIGFDWMWLGVGEPLPQPTPEKIRERLIFFINEMRRLNDPDWVESQPREGAKGDDKP
jgi:hypothetical protein